MAKALKDLSEDGSTFHKGSMYTTSQGRDVFLRKCCFKGSLGCPFEVRVVCDREEEETNIEVSPPPPGPLPASCWEPLQKVPYIAPM